MAAIEDLTWEQVATALGGSGKITVSGGKVLIDVSAITGDSVAALTDGKVVEFACKFLDACNKAQTTANQGQATGERLDSFPAPTYGAVNLGFVPITQTVRSRVALNPANLPTILGPVV